VSAASGGGGGGGGGGSGGGGGTSGAKSGPVASAARKTAFLALGVAAVAGALIAGAAMKRRKVDTKAHPLTGSISKRVQLFSNLAGKGGGARPVREFEREYEVDVEEAAAYRVASV